MGRCFDPATCCNTLCPRPCNTPPKQVLVDPSYRAVGSRLSKILKADFGHRSPVNQSADLIEYVHAGDVMLWRKEANPNEVL